MSPTLPGLHHVTAITADPQANLDFYCGVLGLRLIKLTVNFDDPSSYHLYYADALGTPGTVITFFAWPGAPRGRVGPPQVVAVAFAAPAAALDYWSSRLADYRVEPADRFAERAIRFLDPDGIGLEIVATDEADGHLWAASPVPSEYAIRGFHSVTIAEEGYESTAQTLTELMGFQPAASEGNRFRYRAADAGRAHIVDLLCVPDAPRGSMAAGIVHHVAFRTPDDEQQGAWRRNIVQAGLNVSPVIDRKYFHSIYYREPGGVLFEIATDHPGFTVDEPADRLGTRLTLPARYEPLRPHLEHVLPKLRLPAETLSPASR